MPNYNNVTIMGHMARDPELRYTPNQTAVVNCAVAVTEKYTDKQGNKQESTSFIDFEAWAKLAEIVNQYGAKGKAALIGGKLKQDKGKTNRATTAQNSRWWRSSFSWSAAVVVTSSNPSPSRAAGVTWTQRTYLLAPRNRGRCKR